MLNYNCGNVCRAKTYSTKTVIIIQVAVQYDNGINVVLAIIFTVSKQNPDLPNVKIHHFGKMSNI